MNLTDKQALTIVVVSMALVGGAIALFSIFPNNSLINFLATLILLAGVLIITWLKFYSSIKPFWIGIFFAVFLFAISLIVLMVLNNFFPNGSNLIGIPIVFGLALLLSFFEKPLSKFLLSIFKKR